MTKSRLRRVVATVLDVSQNPEADQAFDQLDKDITTALDTLEAGNRKDPDAFQSAVLPVLNSLATVTALQEPDGTQTLKAFKEFGDMSNDIDQIYTQLRNLYNGAASAKNAIADAIEILTHLQEDLEIINQLHEVHKDFQANQ